MHWREVCVIRSRSYFAFLFFSLPTFILWSAEPLCVQQLCVHHYWWKKKFLIFIHSNGSKKFDAWWLNAYKEFFHNFFYDSLNSLCCQQKILFYAKHSFQSSPFLCQTSRSFSSFSCEINKKSSFWLELTRLVGLTICPAVE